MFSHVTGGLGVDILGRGYTGNRRLLGVQSATLEESESNWFSKQTNAIFLKRGGTVNA